MKKNIFYVVLLSGCIAMQACGNKVDSHDGHDHDHGTEAHDHDHEGHSHDHEDEDKHADEIVFTKKQVENTLNFEVVTIESQDFNDVLKVSGQIVAAPGDEMIISAPMTGIVKFSSNITPGSSVSAGQSLFRISGDNLGENTIETKLIEAKTNYEAAKSEYNRASSLVADKIISEQDFEKIKASFKQAEVAYRSLSKGMSGSERSVGASMSGFLKNILVQSGQFVDMGTPLATVTKNQRLILRADVSQRYLARVHNVTTANFVTPYDNQVYDLKDLNGRLISFGRNSDNSFYIPVSFEFDNRGNVIEGAYVEVYLKSSVIPNAIVVPKVALMEDQGHYFVFVQIDDEGYEKREVELGANDGKNFQIVKGLAVGEKVVFEGAYAVKLASQQGEMPAHSHSH